MMFTYNFNDIAGNLDEEIAEGKNIIKYVEKEVLKAKEPVLSLYFVSKIPTANVEKHREIVKKSKNPKDLKDFDKMVQNVEKTK